MGEGHGEDEDNWRIVYVTMAISTVKFFYLYNKHIFILYENTTNSAKCIQRVYGTVKDRENKKKIKTTEKNQVKLVWEGQARGGKEEERAKGSKGHKQGPI